jgi:hypothetical protein
VELLELRKINSGYEAFPSFVRRQRIPRDGSTPVSLSDDSFAELLPSDLAIGRTVSILGREYLLYDCDAYTQDYYRAKYGVTDFTPVDVYDSQKQTVRREIPAYLGCAKEGEGEGGGKEQK